MSTIYNKRAIKLANEDIVFASIITAANPTKALDAFQEKSWMLLTASFQTTAWFTAAMDMKRGIFKMPEAYSDDPTEISEIKSVQEHTQKFAEYSALITGNGADPLSDYLYGITIEEFRNLMVNLRGLDAAREIQRLYKDGALAHDLGGSKLHRFMEQLNLPYIPSVNQLNNARRGEINPARYNMEKSRTRRRIY